MLNRSRLQVQVLLVGGLVVAACSVDNKGLTLTNVDASRADAAADGTAAGTGGGVGTGGVTVIGTGGAVGGVGSGGVIGSGGIVATGTGGRGTGGSGIGGSASGGNLGSGGAVGTGGGNGTGGVVGSGGTVGSGGAGTGGAGTGGAGTGGAMGICNPSNCPNGCCMGNMCVTNRTDQRCGTAGATCAPCSACSQCSNAGVCGLISDARWNVVCVSATIAPTKVGGAAWDSMSMPGTPGALPDPFCRFTLDGMARSNSSTSILMDTLAPMWNQSITPSSGGMNITHNVLVAPPGRWSVDVIDDDGNMGSDDSLCSVMPRLTAADFAVGIVKFPATQNCTGLVIQLVCAEN